MQGFRWVLFEKPNYKVWKGFLLRLFCMSLRLWLNIGSFHGKGSKRVSECLFPPFFPLLKVAKKLTTRTKTMSQMTFISIIYGRLRYKLGIPYKKMSLPILELLYVVLMFSCSGLAELR